MENKTEILKEMGYDITPIVESLKNPEIMARLTSGKYRKDIVVEPMTDEEIVLFSNRVYDIIKKGEEFSHSSFFARRF